MKKIFLVALISATSLFLHAQNSEEAEQLVREGISLHDKGDYDGAIKKYDAAIKLDKNYFDAYYEKSYSLYAAGKQKECLSVCEYTVKNFPDHPNLVLIYIQYGNVLDDLGKSKQALEVYDEGIQKSGGSSYLLYFNRALTLTRLGREEEALGDIKQSLRLKPLHSSSNYSSGLLQLERNKIPSLLSLLTFLAIEPQTSRSTDALARVKELMGGVTTNGKNTTISIDAGSLTKIDDKSDDNFRIVEVSFKLKRALAQSKEGAKKAGSPADSLANAIDLLITTLTDNKEGKKGFYWEHYVPFFEAMQKEHQVETLAHLVLLADKQEDNADWLKEHEDKVDAFYDWLKAFSWKS